MLAGVRKSADGESLRADAPGVEPLIVDVTDAETIAAARAHVDSEHGGRLAGLVNNAGIVAGAPPRGAAVARARAAR